MSSDISGLLDSWDYHPGQVVARKIKGKDGAPKIQLRIDLGILQMNAEGRPDGKRPYGYESLLGYFASRLKKHLNESADKGRFTLGGEDISRLQQEAIQYHHRYICLYQLDDFAGAVRDTERNLRVFDFVREHAESSELSWAIQQFRPQLIMMHTRAKGALTLTDQGHDAAVAIVQEGIATLREFYTSHERPDLMEHSGELHSLESWLEEVRSAKPMSKREKLQRELDAAVRAEDYEKAAQVRDALKNIKG